MTTYFDQMEEALRAVDTGSTEAMDMLWDIDARIVRDVSLAAVFPPVPARGASPARGGCPPAFARAIHRMVAEHSLVAWDGRPNGPDYPDERAHRDALLQMAWNLHLLFHDLAHDPDWPYGDNPIVPLDYLLGDAAEGWDEFIPTPELLP